MIVLPCQDTRERSGSCAVGEDGGSEGPCSLPARREKTIYSLGVVLEEGTAALSSIVVVPRFAMTVVCSSQILLLFLILVVGFANAAATRRDKHANGKRPSVIFLVPDGYGIATHTLAREVDRVRKGADVSYFHQLPLDDHNVGTIQTKSGSALVTDSAAGGTAFACGETTTNGFIAFDNTTRVCGTVLEGAKAQGYYTGLVTTTRITHATPAVFSSHTYNRDDEATIAIHQLGGYVLGRQADLLFGGGRGFFLPQSDEDSSRTDDRNLLNEAEEQGWQVLQSRQDFDSYSGYLPTLGVFSRSHMSYELDRNESAQPSLIEMATKALDVLDEQDEPFFIMIESGRIDHAGHANDAAAIAHEALHFNKLFAKVKNWVDQRERCTGEGQHDYILISSADHEVSCAQPGSTRLHILIPSPRHWRDCRRVASILRQTGGQIMFSTLLHRLSE
jgi:alkaline phosphatase